MNTNRPERLEHDGELPTADAAAHSYLGPLDPVSDYAAGTVPGETRLPLDEETTHGQGETISKTAGTIAPFEPAPMFNTDRYLEPDEAESETTAGSRI